MPKGKLEDYTAHHLRRDREVEPIDPMVPPPVDGHCPRCDARLHQQGDRDLTCWKCGYRWEASYLAQPLRAGRIDPVDFRVQAATALTEAIEQAG